MAFRINKTSKIVIGIGVVILSGALGFLIWRVNQEESTAPEESEAGGTYGCNCCPEGYNAEGSVPEFSEGCDECTVCTNEVNACQSPTGTFIPQCTNECVEGSDCNERCVWPYVNYCDLAQGCICKKDNNRCGDTVADCEPKCPAGYSECDSCGSDYITADCEGICSDCNNKYVVEIKCKKDTVAPVCGNGIKETGEDCDPKASPTGCNTGYICLNDCSCSATIEDTCGDGTLDPGEECESGDPSGNSCAWVDCNQSTCLCKALSITKGVAESCIDEGTENPKAQLSYTITVANSGTEDRTVTKIEDVLDPKLSTASIIPTGITSPGTYSDGKILWDYQTTNLIVKGGETKVYTYKVEIDKTNFGEYTNTVTLTRSTGVTSEASSKIVADCIIEVPQTGIFDTTLGRIGAGIALLIIGGVVYTIPNGIFIVKKKENTYRYRAGFEKKVTRN